MDLTLSVALAHPPVEWLRVLGPVLDEVGQLKFDPGARACVEKA